VPEITDEMLVLGAQDEEHLRVLRAVGLESTMITPIRAGDRILGALSFVSSTSRRFDARDVELACDIGRQLGVIIRNEQLHAEQAHIARTLQAGLIPQSLPEVPGWEVSSAYRAAGLGNEVGGDFYDLVRYEGGAAAIVGDVLGKGAEAAALTALARHTVAAIVESTGDIPHALRVLNRRLRERDDDFRSLCTVAVVALSSDLSVTVYSAGHPQPVLFGPDGVREVGTTSPMLGFVDDFEIAATVVDVGPGDRLVVYTDGVLDAVGRDGRFGEHGLAEALRALGDGQPAAQTILAAIDRFVEGDQSDDIAILGLTRVAVAAPATARV
jgi:serine phosphatase RsbU (regulator of sigma subunit)